MEPIDSEDLLWELGAAEEGELPAASEELLRAYVAGTLPADEQSRLELELAQSPAGRARLVELAGIALDGPSAEVRARVLARLPVAAKPRTHGDSAPRRIRRGWMAAAAAAAIALVAIGYQLGPGSTPTMEVADFEVFYEGLMPDRSSSPEPGSATQGAADPFRAFPDTPLEVMAKPSGGVRPGVEYGLYLRREGRLERLALEATLSRYCVVFAGPARDLVGEAPGTYALFVLAAPAGKLPAQVRVDGDPVAALEESSEGKAHAVPPLELTREPDPGPL